VIANSNRWIYGKIRPLLTIREKWAEFGSRSGTHIEFVEDYPSWWAPMLEAGNIVVWVEREQSRILVFEDDSCQDGCRGRMAGPKRVLYL
jgi:hypothetical protein